MKRLLTVFVFLMASVLLFSACGLIAQGNRKSGPAYHPAVEEDSIIASMRYLYPASQGVTYLSSEQFLLCRRKQFCPLDGRFTLVPVPRLSEEKLAHVDAPQKKMGMTIQATVLFSSRAATLDAESQAVLDEFLIRISGVERAGLRTVITGYTDSTGSEEMNEKLARDRAESVAAYFLERGFKFKQVAAGGRSGCCYVSPNTTAEGRAKNRRAEIWVVPLEETTGEKAN